MDDRIVGEVSMDCGQGRFRFAFCYRLVMTAADRCSVCNHQAGKVEGGVSKAWQDDDKSETSIALSDPRVEQLAKTVDAWHRRGQIICTNEQCTQSLYNLMLMY